MPVLIVHTNVSKDKVPADFLTKATEVMSKQLGKPAKLFTICIYPDTMMSHGGSTDPCACISINCIGKLGPDVNKDHSSVIGSFISETLGIAKDRFYIEFKDLAASNVGYNGSTF